MMPVAFASGAGNRFARIDSAVRAEPFPCQRSVFETIRQDNDDLVVKLRRPER